MTRAEALAAILAAAEAKAEDLVDAFDSERVEEGRALRAALRAFREAPRPARWAGLEAVSEAVDLLGMRLGLIDPDGESAERGTVLPEAEAGDYADDWRTLAAAERAIDGLQADAGAHLLASRVVDLAEWNEGTAYSAAFIYRAGYVAARVLEARPSAAMYLVAEGRGADASEAGQACAEDLQRNLGLWKADQ